MPSRERGPGAHEEAGLAEEGDTCSVEPRAEANTEADTSTCIELAAALLCDGFYFNHQSGKTRIGNLGREGADQAHQIERETLGIRGITVHPFEVSYSFRVTAVCSTLWFPMAILGGAGVGNCSVCETDVMKREK